MSGLFEIYINHTLSKTQIMEIDKILLDNSSKYLDSFYDYDKLRSSSFYENKEHLYIRNLEIKPNITTYRLSLNKDESDLPVFNKSNLNSKEREWIKDVLDLNKAIEVTMNPFDLIIGNNMLKIDSIVIDLNVLLYHNKKECIQSIRKFVFDIVKMFNNKEFKAFYAFNESKYFDSEYFDIYFDDLFYSISYEQFYQAFK